MPALYSTLSLTLSQRNSEPAESERAAHPVNSADGFYEDVSVFTDRAQVLPETHDGVLPRRQRGPTFLFQIGRVEDPRYPWLIGVTGLGQIDHAKSIQL